MLGSVFFFMVSVWSAVWGGRIIPGCKLGNLGAKHIIEVYAVPEDKSPGRKEVKHRQALVFHIYHPKHAAGFIKKGGGDNIPAGADAGAGLGAGN